MNNKLNIERLLQPANVALLNSRIVVADRDVLKEYDGYISGFGATVINIGIKAALAFYMKEEEKLQKAMQENRDLEKPFRARVVNALALTLGEHPSGRELFHSILNIRDENLSKLYLQTQRITDASVALKLMIRTYKFSCVVDYNGN